MTNEKVVLMAANAYQEKYYIGPEFKKIPKNVLKELQIICVKTAKKLNCVLCVGFYPTGKVYFEAISQEAGYDEARISSEIDDIIESEEQLIKGLELWYKIFVLREPLKTQ